MTIQILMISLFVFTQRVYTSSDSFHRLDIHGPAKSIVKRAAAKSGNCASRPNENCHCRQEYLCETDGTWCKEPSRVCKDVKVPKDECRRFGSHIFYADGGLVCPSVSNVKTCPVKKVLMAVNFGENSKKHTDTYGIDYVTDEGIPYDNGADDKVPYHREDCLYEGVPKKDVPLYQTYIYSRFDRGCLVYTVPTAGDGEYELSIKTGQTGGKAAYGFKLNGQTVVKGFRPHEHAGKPKALDLNVNFKVSGDGTKFAMRGYPEIGIGSKDHSIPLGFCSEECIWPQFDRSWQISAFSVIKYTDSAKQCSDDDNNQCGCRHRKDCRYNLETGKCTEKKK